MKKMNLVKIKLVFLSLLFINTAYGLSGSYKVNSQECFDKQGRVSCNTSFEIVTFQNYPLKNRKRVIVYFENKSQNIKKRVDLMNRRWLDNSMGRYYQETFDFDKSGFSRTIAFRENRQESYRMEEYWDFSVDKGVLEINKENESEVFQLEKQ